MEKVIVTGANGFIGRNFIRYLTKKNVEVYAVSRNHENSTLKGLEKVHLITGSLDKINELKDELPKVKYDAFYHFAWAGTTGALRANYGLQSDNAKFTCDAALVSKALNCSKFITTGTITENVAADILENNYTSENLIYGLAKLYAHKLLDITCKKENINYVWAKLSNIYGGDNTNGNLISYTMKEFNEGRTPSYGPCMQPYNFTYIDDVLEALYLIGNNENHYNEYFISNGECMVLKDYLETLADIYGKKVSIGERADDGVRYSRDWFDNSHLEDIGFNSKYTFIEGINKIRGGK